jgi:hypothetical protein
MPTDDLTEVTASSPDAEAQQEDSDSSDDLASHPKYQELRKKHSAARKGLDDKAKELKAAKAELARLKVLAGESEEEPEQPEEGSQYVTKDELWEIAHKREIELYADDEYKEDVKAGIPREKALRYATLRHGTGDNSARRERMEAMASGSTTDRSLAGEEEVSLTKQQKEMGITPEMIRKYKPIIEGA